MKKILFVAVTAVFLAAGCQKTEIQNEALTSIGFNVQMGKLSKAAPDALTSAGSTNLRAQGFKVWGYFSAPAGDLNYNLGDLYLYKEGTDPKEPIDVTFMGLNADESEEIWAADNTYYWPGQNKYLDIYAVSLYEDAGYAYANVAPNYTNKTVEINDFVVNKDADNDLMVAALLHQTQTDSKYIQPYFHHALTKVLLTFCTNQSESNVYVVSAKLQGVKSIGDLLVENKPGTGNTYTAEFNWKNLDTPTEYDAQYKLGENDKVTIGGSEIPAKLLGSDKNNPITFGSWLLIPQTDLSNVKLYVDYIVEDTRTQQTFDLKVTGKVESWNRNNQITYNMVISPEFITFEPDVTDWPVDKEENENLDS